MQNEITKWFFDNGLIKIYPEQEKPNENSILSTVTYAFIYDEAIIQTVLPFLLPNGQIKGPRSHDNMTAIITYLADRSKIAPGLYKQIRIFPNYLHPRDIFYIAYVQRRWWAFIGLPFLYLIFIYMAITWYKRRPVWWDWKWIKAGFPKRAKIKKTDMEILYWIRLQLPKEYKFMHWTAKTIIPMLRKKYGFDFHQIMMESWYRHPNHPNRNYKLVLEERR